MKTIKIKDKELIKVLKEVSGDIDAARVGMDHHAHKSRSLTERLFSIIREWIPETRGWDITLDNKKNEIKFLHKQRD